MIQEADHEAQACLCPLERLQAEEHGRHKYRSVLEMESDILDASASWGRRKEGGFQSFLEGLVHRQPCADHVVAHVPGSSS